MNIGVEILAKQLQFDVKSLGYNAGRHGWSYLTREMGHRAIDLSTRNPIRS
jgi:hypothetical protein